MSRLLPVLAALAVGCGSGSIAPVSGRVTLNNLPLANAAITFQPVAETNQNPGPGSGGFTDSDGRYTLKIVGKETKGAVVGKHKVRISLVPKDTEDDQPKKYKQLPAKYSGKDTQLEYDVPAGGTDSADFALTS